MKTGTHRDILVAWWLLFDEFEIGNGTVREEDKAPESARAREAHAAAAVPERARRGRRDA